MTVKSVGQAHQIRRCIFCRGHAAKYSLWRFVVNESGKLIWDQQYALAGRGAYMHARAGCWSQFDDCRKWARALRVDGEALDLRALGQLRADLGKLLPNAVGQSGGMPRLRL